MQRERLPGPDEAQITHEYNIIKGFAANAPASALEFVSTMSDQYKCEIEEDGVVTTQEKMGAE